MSFVCMPCSGESVAGGSANDNIKALSLHKVQYGFPNVLSTYVMLITEKDIKLTHL